MANDKTDKTANGDKTAKTARADELHPVLMQLLIQRTNNALDEAEVAAKLRSLSRSLADEADMIVESHRGPVDYTTTMTDITRIGHRLSDGRAFEKRLVELAKQLGLDVAPIDGLGAQQARKAQGK